MIQSFKTGIKLRYDFFFLCMNQPFLTECIFATFDNAMIDNTMD